MKKLLVMLLAMTMVLSMAFTFAACGGDEADSSSASESVADSSAADESVDSSASEESVDSSASEESVADSSVESTESTESSESSEESAESSESSEESVVESSESEPASESESESKADESSSVATGSAVDENYAKGASYTITKNGSSEPATLFLPDVSGGTSFTKWGDVDCTKLTDGLTAAGKDMDGNGSLQGVTVTMVGTNAEFEIIIDLGETRTDIKSFKFLGVRDGVANKNNRGFDEDLALFYVSDTPGSWGKFLNTTFSSEQLADAPLIKHQENEESQNVENFTYTFTIDTAVSGRYVKMLISSDVYCLQFDEIMVCN